MLMPQVLPLVLSNPIATQPLEGEEEVVSGLEAEAKKEIIDQEITITEKNFLL